MRRICILLCLLCFPIMVYSQEWVELYNTAENHYLQDKHLQALDIGEQSLESYNNTTTEKSNNSASILRLLVNICYSGGFYEKGIDYGLKEIDVRKQLGNENELNYGMTLFNVANLYQAIENYKKAFEFYIQTVSIFKQHYEPNNAELLNCQWKLASMYYYLEMLDDAYTLFESTFDKYNEGEEITMDYLLALYDFGQLCNDTKRYEKAITSFSVIKNIYEASGYEETYEYASVMYNLGGAYHHTGQYAIADNFYKKSIDIFKITSGLDSPEYQSAVNDLTVTLQQLGHGDEAQQMLAETTKNATEQNTAASYNNMAALSQSSGDLKSAEQYYIKALEANNKTNNEELLLFSETSLNLALLYLSRGTPLASKRHIDNATSIIENMLGLGVESNEYGTCLHRLALYYSKIGRLNEASNSYKKALDIKLRTKGVETKEYALILNEYGIVSSSQGNYQQADSLYNDALLISEDVFGKNSTTYASILNNRASLHQQTGNINLSKNFFLESISIFNDIGDSASPSYINTSENLGVVMIELGEYQEARRILEETLQKRADLYGEQHPSYATNLLNIARLEQAMSYYVQAEPLFKKVIDIREKVFGKTHSEYGKALDGLALLYQTMGNFKEAKKLLLTSIEIFLTTQGKNSLDYATALENLAALHQLEGNNGEAEILYNEVLEIDKRILGENHPNYAKSLHNLASLYKTQKKYQEAENMYTIALKIDANTYGKSHPSYANTLYNLGIVYQELGKFDKAEDLLNQALEVRVQYLGKDHPDYLYTLYGQAVLYHVTEKYEQSKSLYIEIITKYIDQINGFFPAMSESEKSAYYSLINPVFEGFKDFAVDYYQKRNPNNHEMTEKLYDMQLATKALLLNASKKVRGRIHASENLELIAKYANWIGMKERLVKYYSYTKEQLQIAKISIPDLETEANNLEKELSALSSLFSQEFEKEKYAWNDIRDVLKENEAAIEIIRVKKKYYEDSIMYFGLVLKKTSEYPELVVFNEGSLLESRYIKYYKNAIKLNLQDAISYNKFWKPLNHSLKGIETVYLSTDGIFHELSFGTLYNLDKSKFLIEELDLRLLSNTKELIEKHNRSNSDNNIAEVFGFPDFDMGYSKTTNTQSNTRLDDFGFSDQGISPLPGTKKETENLVHLLDSNQWASLVHVGQKADESSIKKINNPYLVHVATHGFFMRDIDLSEDGKAFGIHLDNIEANPLLRSGLLLAGSGKTLYEGAEIGEEDGILTSYEAMNLNLDNTELVVLSACETGLGEVINGEGVYGLQRALLVAGAKSVIMSLWKVNDQTTQELMTLFYTKWLTGTNKFDAFRQAQIELMKIHSDPYFWGAFVIMGAN